MNGKNNINIRWLILLMGTVSMLFAGILYAWSILKVPFAEELGFTPSALALNFTFTMCFFCLGGVLASKLVRKIGRGASFLIAGVLSGLGFILTATTGWINVLLLYLTYAMMAGLGIGISYILVISIVNSWFPDRRGVSSGILMMGFGASSLILGNLVDWLFKTEIGWKNTFIILGIALFLILTVASFVIKAPGSNIVFPKPNKKRKTKEEYFEVKDLTSSEMIRRFTFWRAFVYLICISAVGNSVISFARDLALSVGASASLATVLVGVLAVCNGLGRILTGAVFDSFGRKFTMFGANFLTIIAAATTLIAVNLNSLPLCILGLCLTGFSYGTSPTVASVFTSAFYGQKNFASNLGVMNFNLMCASFIATACSSLMTASGGYTAPFILLLSISVVALGLNITIKKP